MSAALLVVDMTRGLVTVNGQPIDLPRKEFDLLALLAEWPSRLWSKQDLLRVVWGYDTPTTRTLDAHVCKLRQRLRDAGGWQFIVTVWARGYRLVDPGRESEVEYRGVRTSEVIAEPRLHEAIQNALTALDALTDAMAVVRQELRHAKRLDREFSERMGQ